MKKAKTHKGSNGNGDKTFKIVPEEYLSMDDARLNEDILNVPLDYHFLRTQRNLKKKKLSKLYLEKETLYSEIFVAEKTSVVYDRAPSDKFVEAIIGEDEDYQGIRKNIIEAEHELEDLDSLVASMEIRAKLIQTLSSNIRANN